MAAPTNTALVKKALANSEPSTHGPSVWTGRALQAESDDLEKLVLWSNGGLLEPSEPSGRRNITETSGKAIQIMLMWRNYSIRCREFRCCSPSQRHFARTADAFATSVSSSL